MTHPERWPRSSDVICPICEHRFTEPEWDSIFVEMPDGTKMCKDCDDHRDREYLSTCCTAKPVHDDSDICSRCGEHATFEDEYGNEE